MTRMTGPDCAVMCNLINTHTHTQFSTRVIFYAFDIQTPSSPRLKTEREGTCRLIVLCGGFLFRSRKSVLRLITTFLVRLHLQYYYLGAGGGEGGKLLLELRRN